MANIKSQQKRILTNERARLRNQSVKSALRTAVLVALLILGGGLALWWAS